MRPALEALLAETLFDRETQVASIDLMREAVVDSLDYIREKNLIKNESIRDEFFEKMNKATIVTMYPDEVLNETHIIDLYEELPIDGSESLIEMFVAIHNHNRKIENEPKTSWLKKLQEIVEKFNIKYLSGQNYFCKLKFLGSKFCNNADEFSRCTKRVHSLSQLPPKPIEVLQHGDPLRSNCECRQWRSGQFYL